MAAAKRGTGTRGGAPADPAGEAGGGRPPGRGAFGPGDDPVVGGRLADHRGRVEPALHGEGGGREVDGGPGDTRQGPHGPFEPRGAVASGEAGQAEAGDAPAIGGEACG